MLAEMMRHQTEILDKLNMFISVLLHRPAVAKSSDSNILPPLYKKNVEEFIADNAQLNKVELRIPIKILSATKVDKMDFARKKKTPRHLDDCNEAKRHIKNKGGYKARPK